MFGQTLPRGLQVWIAERSNIRPNPSLRPSLKPSPNPSFSPHPSSNPDPGPGYDTIPKPSSSLSPNFSFSHSPNSSSRVSPDPSPSPSSNSSPSSNFRPNHNPNPSSSLRPSPSPNPNSSSSSNLSSLPHGPQAWNTEVCQEIGFWFMKTCMCDAAFAHRVSQLAKVPSVTQFSPEEAAGWSDPSSELLSATPGRVISNYNVTSVISRIDLVVRATNPAVQGKRIPFLPRGRSSNMPSRSARGKLSSYPTAGARNQMRMVHSPMLTCPLCVR
jgi:hypothetical protein